MTKKDLPQGRDQEQKSFIEKYCEENDFTIGKEWLNADIQWLSNSSTTDLPLDQWFFRYIYMPKERHKFSRHSRMEFGKFADEYSAKILLGELSVKAAVAEIKKLNAEIKHLTQDLDDLKALSKMWVNPLTIYSKEIILKNGSTVFGKIIYQDDKSLKVETLVGYLIVDRAQVVRIVDNVITEDSQEYVPEQIRESYAPPPMPKLAQPRYTSSNNSARMASAKLSANCVLVGNIAEKKDSQGNIIFDGEIKNIGGRRADFVKVDFVFRKNWSGETRTLTTFVKGSYNTFDTGIVSDASLLPGANGKFDLYVPQDFGTFIGYSYVIDWEEYQ